MDERTSAKMDRQANPCPTDARQVCPDDRETVAASRLVPEPQAPSGPGPGRPVTFRSGPGGESPWTAVFGLTTGVTALPSGLARETDVDGERLEVLELDATGLGAIQNGRVDETAASLETGRYDHDGRPVTRLVAELHGVEGFSPAMTAAALHRDGQWFADGLLTRELLDGVRVFTIRASDLDETLRGTHVTTPDSFHVRYTASLREYQGERLLRDAVLDQIWDLEAGPASGGPSVGHRFSVSITTRDALGRPLRTVSCHNTLEANGGERERLAATWYDGGQRQVAIAGECVLGAGDWRAPDTLAWRLSPAGFGSCALGRDGYAAAGDCLAGVFLTAARDGSLFLDPLREALDAGLCDPLGAVTSGAVRDIPYELSWCRRRFEAGKPVARREDTAWRRRAEPVAGQGPLLLAGASHTDERFWSGLCVSRQRLELAEVPQPDGLATTCTATAGLGEQSRPATRLVPGGLATADPEAGLAAAALTREAAAIKAEIAGLLKRLVTPVS